MAEQVSQPLFQFACPYYEYMPASRLQSFGISFIPFQIAVEFRVPKRRIRFRSSPPCAVVSVPKTAMNERDGSVSRQDYVERTGKIAVMQTKPVSF